MSVSTITLFFYGLLRGYDTLELFIYNIYFIVDIIFNKN